MCNGKDDLGPIWRGAKPDWIRVVAQPGGTQAMLKIDQVPPAGGRRYATVKGQIVSADATSVVLAVSPGVNRTFKRDQIAALRVRRPILKRMSGYVAVVAAYLGVYVLAAPLRGQDLDLNATGHGFVNLAIIAPISAVGFFAFNRTKVIYKRTPSK